MTQSKIYSIIAAGLLLCTTSCKVPAIVDKDPKNALPQSWNNSTDSTNTAAVKWQDFFQDQHLVTLIDTALVNNQELLITLQEIEIARNEIGVRRSEES